VRCSSVLTALRDLTVEGPQVVWIEAVMSQLPLNAAYVFLRAHGCREEVKQIARSHGAYPGASEGQTKRAKTLALIEGYDLLDKFLAECWPGGFEGTGQAHLERLRRLRTRMTDAPVAAKSRGESGSFEKGPTGTRTGMSATAESRTERAAVTGRASTAPATIAQPRSSMKPARTKNRIWETMAVWAVAIVVAAPILALKILFDRSSMSLGDLILYVIFTLMIVTGAVASFMLSLLLFVTFWRALWIVNSYRGPKGGQ
jgi:hypothetical protein